uniref:Uncharacterized protein n=1 Tax=Cacopsylla melanoneura TaxID=428564 RepID=A0A8D8TH55_9HEMI
MKRTKINLTQNMRDSLSPLSLSLSLLLSLSLSLFLSLSLSLTLSLSLSLPLSLPSLSPPLFLFLLELSHRNCHFRTNFVTSHLSTKLPLEKFSLYLTKLPLNKFSLSL